MIGSRRRRGVFIIYLKTVSQQGSGAARPVHLPDRLWRLVYSRPFQFDDQETERLVPDLTAVPIGLIEANSLPSPNARMRGILRDRCGANREGRKITSLEPEEDPVIKL